MTDTKPQHVSELPERVFLALLYLMVEEGYLTEDGHLTVLGNQYVEDVLLVYPHVLDKLKPKEPVVTTFDVPLDSPILVQLAEVESSNESPLQAKHYWLMLRDIVRNLPANLDDIVDKDLRWSLQSVRDEFTRYEEQPGNLNP